MLVSIDPIVPDPITLRNRANAAHSTGPRTAEGKAIVSRNATKHGLLSNAIIATAFEEQADWEDHLASYFDRLDPRDHPEQVLAEHIAFLHWRRARLHRYETAAIDANLQAFEDGLQDQQAPTPAILQDATTNPLDQPASTKPQPRPLTPRQIAVRRATCVLAELKVMDRIMRYENQIAKDLERSMQRLDQLKATRGQRLRTLLQSRSQSALHSRLDPDLAPTTLLMEDPRANQFAPYAVDPAVTPATGAALIPPAEAAELGQADPAASACPSPSALPATSVVAARAAKQTQKNAGTKRPAHGRPTLSRAQRRRK